MRYTILLTVLLLCACGQGRRTTTDPFAPRGDERPASNDSRFDYIERFRAIAVREMERTGIPASIKLAQGILESNAGQSTLARKAKNHFGIKCGYGWEGGKFYREDDDYDDQGNLIESCFRTYRDSEASYVAHSEFLRDPRKAYRYGFLFRLPTTDYRSWARGLRQAGYATNPRYADILISLIERYQLAAYDRMSSQIIDGETLPDEQPLAAPVIAYVNDVKVAFAGKNETPQLIASRTDVSLKRILDYNENLKSGSDQLAFNERVFLQRKRNNYRGREKWHYVKAGENMYAISQQYGIKLSSLYEKNKMNTGDEPAVGERLRLRGKTNIAPKLRSEGPSPYLEMEEPLIDMPMDEGHSLPDEQMQEEMLEVPVLDTLDVPVIPDPVIEDEGVDLDPPDPPSTPEVPNKPEITPPQAVYHTVKKGETLYRISKNYNVTVEQIKQLNQLTDNIIQPGQQLRVR